MPQAAYVLFGAVLTVATAIALGRVLLRFAGLTLRREEENPLAFVAGSAVLSLLIFLLLLAGAGFKGVYLALAVAALVVAWRPGALQPAPERFEPLPRSWRYLWIAGFGAFTFVYLMHGMAPEISPDGGTYHLSFVARYAREHSIRFLPDNMYAQLSQGIEMLFTMAFAFGRHSASALVHTSFLVTLGLLVLNYGRRCGQARAGVAASLFVYASPLMGIDGVSAYIDVAVAAILFAVFYLLEVWREDSAARKPLMLIGLIGGFAYASKYTAFLAVPYAMAYVWTRRRRDWRGPLLVAACSLLLIAPWVLRNAWNTGNPFSPMLNAWFPNNVVSIEFEQSWAAMLRDYDIPSKWRIPYEATVRGEYLVGFFGAIFLLAPVALAAIRYPHGRRLLLAFLVFALPYPMNIGARFLIPAMPFLALAMALAWSSWPAVLASVAVLHAVSSWPSVLPLYAGPYSWRIRDIPVRAALRLESEDAYLTRKRADYPMVRSIERLVPPGQRVLSTSGIAEAFTKRDVRVGFQSSSGQTLTDMLYTSVSPALQPARIVRLPVPSGTAAKLRVEQTAVLRLPVQWSVHEVRLYRGETEIARNPRWRITARPNPWDISLAFDNSPVTRWRTKQAPEPGMFIEIDLGGATPVDRVDVLTSPDSAGARLRLLEWSAGAWKPAGGQAEEILVPAPPFMGRAAMREWKARGVDFLVICNNEWSAGDILEMPAAFGLKPVITHGECHLLRNDAGLPRLLEKP